MLAGKPVTANPDEVATSEGGQSEQPSSGNGKSVLLVAYMFYMLFKVQWFSNIIQTELILLETNNSSLPMIDIDIDDKAVNRQLAERKATILKVLDTITEETIAKCVTLLEQLALPTTTEKTVSE